VHAQDVDLLMHRKLLMHLKQREAARDDERGLRGLAWPKDRTVNGTFATV
jgi:hypothetical protein